MRFEGKTVLVTGASRGLGRYVAERFAAEGAKVVLVARDEARLKEAVAQINAGGGQAVYCVTDISEEEGARKAIETTWETCGSLDILLNNAAVHKAVPVWEMSTADWERMIKVNLTGAFLCAREAVKYMRLQNKGVILNVSSTAAYHYFPGFAAYAAAKAGMNSLTKTLAVELQPFNIRVNALSLGLVNTEYSRERIKDSDPHTWLQPEEVAEVILFLASEEARGINGAVVEVTGNRL
ncbi:SDR family NAD(P)-dependent oxidoreductase [Moorellaceae bacterium AZ2]